MRWEDERYVRVYTRDTADWNALSWDAQSLFLHLLRKVDRAGILPLGRHGKRAVALALHQPGLWDRLQPALEELLDDGCVEISGDALVIPNFIEAQETRSSDAQRKRDQRSRDAARKLAAKDSAPTGDTPSPDVTSSHQKSPDVTAGHSMPCRAVPSSAVVVGVAEPPPLTLEPTKPEKPPRKLSAQQRFWAWAQNVRAEEGMLPDSRWPEARINKLLAWVADHPPEAVTAAYGLFLDDERMQAQSPPCPMAFFASDWPKWMDMAEREGLLDPPAPREAVSP